MESDPINTIDIIPMGAKRINYKGKWQPVAQRYFAYCNELRLKYRHDLPASFLVTFYMPIPKSWSKKKQAAMVNQPHTTKPDADNLLKAVMDALCKKNKEGKKDDGYIWRAYVEKYWSATPGIEIETID